MPRVQSFTTDELRDRALWQFWRHGFEATSMDELVATTGVSRHGIYKAFGGKRALYLACFERYQQTIVSPAFSRVETSESDLADVRAYFEYQIDAAERLGLPGPGCFVANSATETAPHDSAVSGFVRYHNDRLKAGFANALVNSASEPLAADTPLIDVLSEALLVFATGLWAVSRVTSDAARLRSSAGAFIDLVEGRLPCRPVAKP